MRIVYSKREPAIPLPMFVATALGLALWLFLRDQFLLCALIFCFGLVWSAVTQNDLENPVEFDKVYLLIVFFYCVVPFIGFALKIENYYSSALDTATFIVIALFLVGVVFGDRVASSSPFRQRWTFDREWDLRRAKIAGIACIVIGAGLFVILVAQVGLNRYLSSKYVEIFEAENGKGYLVAGFFLMEVGILVLAIACSEYRKKFSWTFLLPFLTFAVVQLRIGKRGLVINTAIALLVVYHFFHKRVSFYLLSALIAGLLAMASIVGFARSFSSGGWDGMVYSVKEDFTKDEMYSFVQEPAAVQMSLREVLNLVPRESPYRYGMTIVEAFEILVPLKLHPTRPLGPSQWFVWFYDPNLASAGGGYAFSTIAEGYLNFGYFGVFGVGLLQGYLVRRAVMFRMADASNRSRLLLYACLFTQTQYLIRGDFASFLKQGVVATFIPALLVLHFVTAKPKGVLAGPIRLHARAGSS